jgi:hypothetical protein
MMSEAFDPFNVSDADDLFTATVPPKQPEPAAQVQTTRARSFKIKPHSQNIAGDKPKKVVLPEMDVKLQLHEEVSSKALPGGGEDGTVELFVEGKVMVRYLFIRFNIMIVHISCAAQHSIHSHVIRLFE